MTGPARDLADALQARRVERLDHRRHLHRGPVLRLRVVGPFVGHVAEHALDAKGAIVAVHPFAHALGPQDGKQRHYQPHAPTLLTPRAPAAGIVAERTSGRANRPPRSDAGRVDTIVALTLGRSGETGR